MQRWKTRIIAGAALLLIAGCCVWFNQVDSIKREIDESMNKAERDFRKFIEMSEEIIDGEMISFDDYTEHYMQLRVRLSNWNHLYNELHQTKLLSRNKGGVDTLIGDFYVDVENFYFSVIHVYYI